MQTLQCLMFRLPSAILTAIIFNSVFITQNFPKQLKRARKSLVLARKLLPPSPQTFQRRESLNHALNISSLFNFQFGSNKQKILTLHKTWGWGIWIYLDKFRQNSVCWPGESFLAQRVGNEGERAGCEISNFSQNASNTNKYLRILKLSTFRYTKAKSGK